MRTEDNKEGQLTIDLPAEVAEGTYSNLSVITHSTSEMVFDFIRIVPGVPQAKVKSRVIMTPENAKRLLFALQKNIQDFEYNFGEIRLYDLQPEEGQKGTATPFGVPEGLA